MGFIFTDVPHPDYDKVCDGLYYRAGQPWEPSEPSWGSKPRVWISYPRWAGPLPYLREKTNIYGVNLLSNFPWGPYDVRPNITANLVSNSDHDSICILNHTQGLYFEDILVLDFGFRVVSRAMNPKHNSRLILYHKEPGI